VGVAYVLIATMVAQAGPMQAQPIGSELAANAVTAVDEDAPQEVIVTGRASKLYRVDETVTGRLPTQPLASSQNITVITEQLIEDQGARDAQDLYRNISGVSFFSYAGVTARGFRQEEIFYDNLRGDPYAGFAVPQLFNIERIEFLKGPAGMLYGAGAPGGLFNYVTKKPSERFSAQLSGVIGTGDRHGASAEITGAILPGLGTRAGIFYEDRDTFRFNAGSETVIADGGVAYAFGPAKLTLQATHYDQDLPSNRLRGVPVDNDGNFLASRRWNHNEPDDFLRLNSDVAQALLAAEIAPGLTVDAGLRYNDARERQKYHEPRGLFDSNGDGAVDATIREFRDQARREEKWSFGANAIWAADFGAVKNRVLAGYDRFTEDQTFAGRSLRGRNRVVAGLPSPLSLSDPQYGRSDRDTYNLPAFTTTLSEQKREGAYLLEEATIGPVIAILGLRHDSFRDDNGSAIFSDDELTYRAGLVYRIAPDISLFGQYATSFEPQDAANQDPRAGGPFDPTTGDIYEAGIKTALFNGRLQTTLSAYRIQRRNILQADPDGDADEDGVDDLVALGR
jgi:iron complex outermembrane recepter protein